MAKKAKPPQSPLILRHHRLMDAFSKSNNERDFYLDKMEGFLIYIDFSKSEEELAILYEELRGNPEKYALLPKLTFYETKKIMEGFVNEKVYDIDTKEKLNDIIHSKEAKENFLEFIHDHHHELDKWHLFYQERSRVRIIEWLRANQVNFVFEEDIELPAPTVEKLKKQIFQSKVQKEVAGARELLEAKAKTYYSNEALNPRPKRGRPPKQVAKVHVEPQYTGDFYTTVPLSVRPFLYIPEITSVTSITFSSKFDTEEELIAHFRNNSKPRGNRDLEALNKKLASFQTLTARLSQSGIDVDTGQKTKLAKVSQPANLDLLKSSEAIILREPEPAPARKSRSTKAAVKSESIAKKDEDATSAKPKKAPVRRLTPTKKAAAATKAKKK
jgi:hypothetical protein